jgi:threonine aldolase
MTPRFDFASDNTAGMAPEALAALVDANAGAVEAYGEDATSAHAARLVRELLDVDASVHFVPTGTAANALALATLCGSHQAVAVHGHAHVRRGEAGAPGFFGGGLGLVPVEGDHGRIAMADLEKLLTRPDSSSDQPLAALSISNPTEYGVLYPLDALAALVGVARDHGLAVHLDGARLACAAAAGLDLRALARLDISILVLGGTKAGMPGSEAIVLLDKGRDRHFVARIKQSGHLLSKGRFLAAPWIGMLESGAWIERSRHANRMARRLIDRLATMPAHPVETNAVFMAMDVEQRARLRALGWVFYSLADGHARFLCSWSTTETAIDELADAIVATRP